MKEILSNQTVKIPPGVSVTSKSRVVTVTGPRGVLKRNFKHVVLDIRKVNATELRIEKWFGSKKEIACVRTICSHIENMITGVTEGFQYKMRAACIHFPIICVINEDGTIIEVRNFLGQKFVKKIKMAAGVTVRHSKDYKDELILEGNSLEDVSRCAALLQQATVDKKKDCRVFLDGLYVSEKRTISGVGFSKVI